LIFDEVVDITIKNKLIVKCALMEEEQLTKLNLGNKENSKIVLINVTLPSKFVKAIEILLQNYMDVFAWNYKELKKIPRQICEHMIELMAIVRPIKQKQYKMHLNYALKAREDLDKLLDIRFIYPIESTQWISPLVIVPKKKWQAENMCGYWKLNV
jgi:hypothetical protein